MPYPRPERLAFPPALALFLAALATGLLPLTADAQESAESPLRRGAWALGFDWISDGSFYGVGSTRAVGFSAKRHASESTALRLGFGVDFEESEREGGGEQYDTYYGGPGPSDVQDNFENEAVSVYLQWMGYRPVRDRLGVFVALGPTFNYGSSKASYLRSRIDVYREDVSASVRRNAGLLGHVGFEWYFTKRLSLAGQIATIAAYEWGGNSSSYLTSGPTFTNWDREQTDMRGVRFRTGRAVFMVSAYL